MPRTRILQLIPEPVLDLYSVGAVDTEILTTIKSGVLSAEVPPCQSSSEDDPDTGSEIYSEGENVSWCVGVEV